MWTLSTKIGQLVQKFKLYVRKNEQRLQAKSVAASSTPFSPYNEVAVQTEPEADPDRVDAEVQTDKPNLGTTVIAQIDLQPVDRAEIGVQTDQEVMVPT